MPDLLMICRSVVGANHVDQVVPFFSGMHEAVSAAPGYRGASLWRKQVRPEEFMAVIEFDDLKTFLDASEHFVVEGHIDKLAQICEQPLDSIEIEVVKRHGSCSPRDPRSRFLSVSERIADLGRNEPLERDLEEILGTISQIPGYLGSLWGRRVGLSEEIVSLAFWASEAAYRDSVPTKPVYAVTLYRHVQ